MTHSLAVSWMMVVVGRVVDCRRTTANRGRQLAADEGKVAPTTKTRFEAVNFYNEEGKGDGRSAAASAAAVLQ